MQSSVAGHLLHNLCGLPEIETDKIITIKDLVERNFCVIKKNREIKIQFFPTFYVLRCSGCSRTEKDLSFLVKINCKKFNPEPILSFLSFKTCPSFKAKFFIAKNDYRDIILLQTCQSIIPASFLLLPSFFHIIFEVQRSPWARIEGKPGNYIFYIADWN